MEDVLLATYGLILLGAIRIFRVRRVMAVAIGFVFLAFAIAVGNRGWHS